MTSYLFLRITFLTICGFHFASGSVFAADTQVSGRIIVSGKPLGGGKLVLHLGNGEFLGTSVSNEGTYAFRKLSVPPAEYKVTIEGKGLAGKYSDEETTGLRVKVREGENIFDFDLQ